MALERIDTSNPPGNETKIVEYLKLEKVGKRVYPESTVLPAMVTWYTDMALLRAKGVQ